jgi:hypothetical protein
MSAYLNEALLNAFEARFAGQRIAYHYESAPLAGHALTIMVDGEGGYHPLPSSVAIAASADEVRHLAARLNRERLHLTPDEVTMIVPRSMRPAPRGRRAESVKPS